MRRWIGGGIIAVLLFGGHILALQKSAEANRSLAGSEQKTLILPSPILKLMALEFDGVVSTFLFLEASTFYGEMLESGTPLKNDDWQWIAHVLTASTDLDPYFYDPYYFGNAILSWNGFVQEANELLEKGVRHRNWDWTLPLYVGFNYFYFLHDHGNASTYLMESGRRPGAPPFVSSLAARLAHQGNQTQNAILFLEEIIGKTEDRQTAILLETRLEALRGIFQLEQAVAKYKLAFNHKPETLAALVEKGILQKLPLDPYGGDFYLAADGSIKTTSELRQKVK